MAYEKATQQKGAHRRCGQFVGRAGFFVSFLYEEQDASPVLELKGYELRGTNAGLVAKLELKNATGRTIWLCLSGTDFPLRPPFVTRPLVVEHTLVTSPVPTNVYSQNAVGSFFMSGQPVRPSETLSLEYPMTAQESAERVGVAFYTGKFADANDFLDNLGVPCPFAQTGLKENLNFALSKLKRRFEAPEYHEVWCAETLTNQQKLANRSADRVE